MGCYALRIQNKRQKKTAHTTHENELKRRENKEQFSSISLNLWLLLLSFLKPGVASYEIRRQNMCTNAHALPSVLCYRFNFKLTCSKFTSCCCCCYCFQYFFFLLSINSEKKQQPCKMITLQDRLKPFTNQKKRYQYNTRNT